MQKFTMIPTFIVLQCLASTYAYGQTSSYNASDLNWYIKSLQREAETAREQLKKYKEDKGYDPQAVKLIDEASNEIRNIDGKIQELQTKKMTTSNVLINMSVIKDKRNTVKDDLVALGALIPSGPKSFPERCVIYKASIPERGDEIAKKEGLEKKIGKIEPMGYANNLVLSTPDPNDPGKSVTYELNEKVGLVGSMDPNATQSVKQPTPANMTINAWVDVESKKVMCVTQPIAATQP